jgi:hypothetical protein
MFDWKSENKKSFYSFFSKVQTNAEAWTVNLLIFTQFTDVNYINIFNPVFQKNVIIYYKPEIHTIKEINTSSNERSSLWCYEE